MPEREIFISVDIEADGRIPGRNPMLRFGSVGCRAPGLTASRIKAS